MQSPAEPHSYLMTPRLNFATNLATDTRPFRSELLINLRTHFNPSKNPNPSSHHTSHPHQTLATLITEKQREKI